MRSGRRLPAGGRGRVTFASGEATKTVNVTVCRDATPESNETFFVNLSGAVNATITDPQGQGTIVNDDVSFSIDDVTHLEGNSGTTSFVFTVTKIGTVSGSRTVQYATADGTATAPSDYTAPSC